MVFRSSGLLLCAILIACDRSSPRAVHSDSPGVLETVPTGSVPPAVTSGSSTATSSCPRTGRWALCSVERRLQQSGFVLRRAAGQAERRPGFSVVPAIYTLGGSRLEVFVYADEAALARDVTKIDTITASPVGAPNTWRMAPTWVRSGNLVAVFLTDNGTQAERLMLALTAGAPQP